MSTHTPGPWILKGWTAPDDYGWSIKIGDAPHRLDVSAWSQSSEADARLIAAAPDLLALVEALIRPGGTPASRRANLLRARALVAKVRGGK